MITGRTTPRTVMTQWLSELNKGALAEGAEHTSENLTGLSQSILTMVASSDEADIDKMKALTSKDSFQDHAKRYMLRNWFLNTGLNVVKQPESVRIHLSEVSGAIDEAINTLVQVAGEVDDISGPRIAEMTNQVAETLGHKDHPSHELHGEGTAILLREVLGMPGDERPCKNITNKEQLEVALNAMVKLGVDVTPTAYVDLQTVDALLDDGNIFAAADHAVTAALAEIGVRREDASEDLVQILTRTLEEQARISMSATENSTPVAS